MQQYYFKWLEGPQAFIHIDKKPGNWTKDIKGNVVPQYTPNIPVIYPDHFHNGLWGGEGVIKGIVEPPLIRGKRDGYCYPKYVINIHKKHRYCHNK